MSNYSRKDKDIRLIFYSQPYVNNYLNPDKNKAHTTLKFFLQL